MSDDQPPDEARDESTAEPADHVRDEHMASLLEVPPLDELTRRRLVSRALAGAGTRRGAGPGACCCRRRSRWWCSSSSE